MDPDPSQIATVTITVLPAVKQEPAGVHKFLKDLGATSKF
jgi:hypothetical protein